MKFIYSLLMVLAISPFAFCDDNIVIVFDTSGSMGEYMRSAQASRMKVAQDALISVVSKVPDTTKVGILTFNGWVYDLQRVDQAKIAQAIRSCTPSGGTPLYPYIRDGANRLLQERTKQGNVGYYKLLVVTDGVADSDALNRDGTFGDGTPKPGVLKDIISRGIAVDAIGLDMRGDHPLKTQINGFYMRGDDPKSIQQSLQKAVAEVGFNGKDGVNDAIFLEVSELPEEFVRASIKGLTEFRNHNIGELAPIMMVKDGVLVSVPAPGQNAPTGGGGGWLWWMLAGAGVIVVIGVVVVCSKS